MVTQVSAHQLTWLIIRDRDAELRKGGNFSEARSLADLILSHLDLRLPTNHNRHRGIPEARRYLTQTEVSGKYYEYCSLNELALSEYGSLLAL